MLLKNCKFSAVSTAVFAVVALSAHAQQAPQPQDAQQLERVEITGSSIKRIAAEGALPVQIFSEEQIKRTGATSVAELIQKLPAMQGFSISDTAIGSNSGGFASASIHNIGESYTLVLLNGRRVAPTGSGNGVNLSAIPMSAIARVEVLTDGASALYGADAIAGVVNFVLKRNVQGGTVEARMNVPLEGGGRSSNASITYGMGDLDKDRFNFVATYRHDDQQQLKSGDRSFAKTAYLPVTLDGKSYVYDRTSTSAVPANAQVTFNKASKLPVYSFNPYQKSNGSCAANNFYSLNNSSSATSVSQMCAFDFVSTIDIFPESKTDSLFATGQFKVNNALTLFSDAAYSRLNLIARIAPNPVPVTIPTSSSLFTQYVAPNLSATQLANVSTVQALYRAQDFGTRDSRSITDSKHFVVGADAEVGTWNINGALTWSENAINEQYVGGYFKTAEFTNMVKNVSFDPFAVAGNQSAATQQLIANSIFHGTVRNETTTLTGADVRASGEIFNLPGGAASLGVGGDVHNTHFKRTPSEAAVNGDIYNYAATTPYDMKRDNAGAFVELLMPLSKAFELTAAGRYDTFSAIKDSLNNKTVGDRQSAATYKLSARYQLSNAVLLRGSYGTGFKAPSMLDIAQPLVANGVTASAYDCPFPGTDACKAGKTQYSQMSGGNDQLKPEKSKQGTLGVRFEPTSSFGIGADYWTVKITDAVSAVSANQAFADPAKYASLFTTYKQPAELQPYYAYINASTNIGQSNTSGIDWDVVTRFQMDFGRVTAGWSGTYLIDASYTRPGTSNDFTDSMGHYGEDATVAFRNISRASLTVETGAFTNNLVLNMRSGYRDRTQTVRDMASGLNTKITLNVPSYYTLDYQGSYKYTKALEFRLGMKNVLNMAPPLSLRDSSGHQVGYDPRYASPMMRTLYASGSFTF
ncbi:TonB-dependent receptor domain-containing protein [Roseateles koreensis]|uniref:TonB-dependent receptor n=1 Tax=Roseateles koreensis TaxID=2987526 RepID=A0ABT5KVT3_9BURK|nr:TonB-dependent receptor [Roseateles koreensis]MDC8787050.1 TonB-dependent receptor [Roseateles koreensis]